MFFYSTRDKSVAARQGLEPQLKVPKTSVLPLHHQAKSHFSSP